MSMSQSMDTKLQEAFKAVIRTLYTLSDPLIHAAPEWLSDYTQSADSRAVSRTRVDDGAVLRVTQGISRISSSVSSRLLILCQALWCAFYGHTLQICCALMSLNFLIHTDVVSCFFPVKSL